MAERSPTRARSTSSESGSRTPAVHGPRAVAQAASEELEGLIGHPPEGMSAVRRTDDGWCAVVDVLEVERIPDTTSLLASYEVLLGPEGELLEYRRVRRYRRGSADE